MSEHCYDELKLDEVRLISIIQSVLERGEKMEGELNSLYPSGSEFEKTEPYDPTPGPSPFERELKSLYPSGTEFEKTGPYNSTPGPSPSERELKIRSSISSRSNDTSGKGALGFVAIGVTLIFLGSIFGGLTWVIEPPELDEYNNNYKRYDKAQENYGRMLRWFTFINEIFWVAGALVLAGGLMGVALLKQNIHPQTKTGLLIGAALIIGFMMMNKTGMFGLLSILE
jgi:hypothetical protein